MKETWVVGVGRAESSGVAGTAGTPDARRRDRPSERWSDRPDYARDRGDVTESRERRAD